MSKEGKQKGKALPKRKPGGGVLLKRGSERETP